MNSRDRVGDVMYSLIEKLFPLYRTIAGPSLRYSLQILEDMHCEFKRLRFRSGLKVFDWEVPKEWIIRDAYIEFMSGRRIAQFSTNNLSVVGYSRAINMEITRSKLLEHIHISKKRPEARPYVTSYYASNWGFCLTQSELKELVDDSYRVVIDSEHKQGHMDMIEAVVKGRSNKEVLFASYICHPSMANNELSGPALLCSLLSYIKSLTKRRYTYRFVVSPETIGSLAYLSKRRRLLRKRLIAGFNLSCVGDNRAYSYVSTPSENTLADQAIRSALFGKENVEEYSFLHRGSDERQYCSPRIGLPVITFCRSKFHTYPEYHTSDDNLGLVSSKGLEGSFTVMKSIIDAMEAGIYPVSTTYGEPMLSKRDLYPTLSTTSTVSGSHINLRNLLAYSNGERSIFDIAIKLSSSLEEVNCSLQTLKRAGLISIAR